MDEKSDRLDVRRRFSITILRITLNLTVTRVFLNPPYVRGQADLYGYKRCTSKDECDGYNHQTFCAIRSGVPGKIKHLKTLYL